MTLSQHSRLSIEAFAVRLRWVQLLGAAVLLSDRIANPVVIAVLAWGLGSNIWAHKILARTESYEKRGSKILAWIRATDVLMVALAPLVPVAFGHDYWVLFVPTLLSYALLSNRKLTFGLMAGCIGTQVLLTYLNVSPWIGLVAPISAALFGGLTGMVLTTYQTR
ncbi:MAG: hypothetical protein ABL962_21885, partial [Fimbriimonadaceae bacterium]